MEGDKTEENAQGNSNPEPTPKPLPEEKTIDIEKQSQNHIEPVLNKYPKWYESYKEHREFINTCVNALMLVVTVGVFIYAVGQSEEAKEATDISRKQYDLSVRAMKESDSTNRIVFKRDSANAQAQIDAMTEQVRLMKEQFEITNKPFLSIENPRPINFSMNEPISINYEIVNLGNYPVKIIRAIDGGTFNDNIKKINNHLDEIDFEDDISYIAKIPKVKTSKLSHGKSDIHYFENKLPYYFFGKIIYINPANNTKRQLRFIIRLVHPEIPHGGFDYVQIDNTDL